MLSSKVLSTCATLDRICGPFLNIRCNSALWHVCYFVCCLIHTAIE